MRNAITAGINFLRQTLFQEREAAGSLRRIIDNLPANIVYFDTELRYVFVNKAIEDIYGLPQQDIIGKRIGELQSEAAYAVNRPHFEAALRGENVTFEMMVTMSDGTTRNYQASCLPDFDEHGLVIGCYNVSVNISARVVAEKRLQQETAQRVRLITDNLPAWVSYTDAEQRYQFANKTCADWLARPFEDIIGRTVSELTELNYEKLRPQIAKALAGEQVSFVEHFTYPNGVERTVQVQYVPHFGEAGNVEGYFSLIEDISELQQAEERLRQSQKMEAVGQLTGGVAHDFNNLLAVILTSAELLGNKIGDNQLLATIRNAATRGGELTGRLLSFSRQQDLRPQAVDLKALIPGLLDLLQRTLGEPVKVLEKVPVGIWPVMADPGQLESALLNLSVNARDAMPGGGILEIECSNVELREGDKRVSDEIAAGKYVQIAVRDNGAGMPEEVLEHAFEPFYTTKQVGEGTGLGLSMVYGFARQSGGDSVIESTPGKGTEVKIFLPRAVANAVSGEKIQDVDLNEGQGETILVLEDDPDVRFSTVLVLEGMGYRVLEAADANEAMQILETETDNLDLLLSDVVLSGGVSGPEFAATAKAHYPNLKIVFMSGYTVDLHTHHEIPSFDEMLLTKPFSRANLNKAIQTTLAAA